MYTFSAKFVCYCMTDLLIIVDFFPCYVEFCHLLSVVDVVEISLITLTPGTPRLDLNSSFPSKRLLPTIYLHSSRVGVRIYLYLGFRCLDTVV